MCRAVMVFFVSLLIAVTFGCKSPETRQMDEPGQTRTQDVELGDVIPEHQEGDQAMSVRLPTDVDTEPRVETITPDEPESPVGRTIRMHVVQRGDTLYKLARMYYGNQRYWRQIWQANLAKVPDPNKIQVGTELLIP